jgi:hypothetical protein
LLAARRRLLLVLLAMLLVLLAMLLVLLAMLLAMLLVLLAMLLVLLAMLLALLVLLATLLLLHFGSTVRVRVRRPQPHSAEQLDQAVHGLAASLQHGGSHLSLLHTRSSLRGRHAVRLPGSGA